MSIRNEFEKIDPTEKQKKDIFRRIEESSKVKTDFRHQVIRYTSVAAAAVVVVGTAAVGVHFVTKGNGIDYTVSGRCFGRGKQGGRKSITRRQQFRKRQQYDISRYKHLKGAGA